VVCEPTEAQLLGDQPFKPHKIQGWTPDFVPAVLDRTVFDDRLAIGDGDAIATARELAHKEGIFVGISAGGTFAGALQVARAAPAGSAILAMLPDTGERYLSTALFEGVNQGSDPV
jgi:cysteine synthase A